MPTSSRVDVSLRELEAYPTGDRRVRRESHKHSSDRSLQTLETRGSASPFRVWLSGEKGFGCVCFISHDRIACWRFLVVVITVSRPGSVLSGQVACPCDTICATWTLHSTTFLLFLDLPLAPQEMHAVRIVQNVTVYYTTPSWTEQDTIS